MSARIEHHDLLIEIGTEELPPKALKTLRDAFRDGVLQSLKQAGLSHKGEEAFAAPRRLALLVHSVQSRQKDAEATRRGPAVTAAFDGDGKPTKAAEGFARSCGVSVDQLETEETDKGAWLVHRSLEKGQPAVDLIPGIVEQALAGLPIPKRMRWGAGEAEFVRPVHWVVLLFGDAIIDAEILGVRAGRETRGHRFHHPQALYLDEPAAYAPLLETEGKVVASFDARREAILAQVQEAAHGVKGRARIDEDLLDEVAALVEWPVAVTGRFEESFLEVPHEALISTMQDNQKYFPVVDDKGRLLPYFVTVANIESDDPDKIREGNERVIRPRFADAAFFWDQDRKQPLAEHRESLKSVVFQKKLGTLYDKSERVARLAEFIALEIGTEPDEARRAGELGKCDLMTQMVYEFPELQGIMGRYYARHDGEPKAVAEALDEQYMPRHAGDELPAGGVGQALALADRLDTLLGIFAIGQKPTGTKDPFGLRRAALGVLRILIEKRLDLDLEILLQHAARGLEGQVDAFGAVSETFDYVMERLKAYYQDRGVSAETFEAVHAVRPTRPLDFDHRIQAVAAFIQLPEAESLAAANKRIRNILKQVEGGVEGHIDSKLLKEPAEQALAEQVSQMHAEVDPLFDKGDYRAALTQLAGLREAVDRFFDDVMVMVEDEALKNNRIALLNGLGDLFLRAADLSRLKG
jgi:glycyl-tRNA synthetase beta chain